MNIEWRKLIIAQDRIDNLEADLAAAQQRITELESERDKYGSDLDTVQRNLTGHLNVFDATAREFDLQGQLFSAQQRIADLEWEREKLTESRCRLDTALVNQRLLTDEAHAILRAIYPVYRAAVATIEGESPYMIRNIRYYNIMEAVDSAHRAFTPDLVAALRAMGLEEP